MSYGTDLPAAREGEALPKNRNWGFHSGERGPELAGCPVDTKTPRQARAWAEQEAEPEQGAGWAWTESGDRTLQPHQRPDVPSLPTV